MNQATWTALDDYITDRFVPADPVLAAALADSAAADLPPHHVAPPQGKLLHLLARLMGARRILELGTLGAYSTIWLARALPPGGRVITLEFSPKHAAVARGNITRAGLDDVIELREGAAIDSLAQLVAEGAEPFDLIFIDADKPNNPAYVRGALQLARPGTLLILDNVVRNGGILDPASDAPGVQGTRDALDLLAAEPRVSATALQTVGSKGWDGFALALVIA